MPVPRLDIDDTAVLVIDVQERLMPTIEDGAKVTANCRVLLQMAEALSLPYLLTEQYPQGLGRTVEEVAGAMSDQSRRVEKTRFSAAVEIVEEHFEDCGRSTVIVGGVEAHVCVLQTVLDFQRAGRQCFVCSDAVSSGQADQVVPALHRMRAAGAVVSGVISAMYELMDDARHPAFRRCLDLAKAVRF